MYELADAQREEEELVVGIRTVQALLVSRRYGVMVGIRAWDATVSFHLTRDGSRRTLLVQRATLLGKDLERHLNPFLVRRISDNAVTVLEEDVAGTI
jgi:hypothetical protein